MMLTKSVGMLCAPFLLFILASLAGCLSYGKYEWWAYSSNGGYVVDVTIRTDVEKSFKSGWEREFIGPSKSIVIDDLRAKGLNVMACEPLGPAVMNQGGMLIVIFVAGDVEFVGKHAESIGATYHTMIDGAPIVARGTGTFPINVKWNVREP